MFRYGSPFMRTMTLITNLMLLNLLWLVTSLPLITIGASTSAMYFVLFQYVTKQDDALLKPYFRAIRENFKQATLLWIPHSLIGVLLAAELYYLNQSETGMIWWLLFGILVAVYLLVSTMLYPMLGRYKNTTRAIVFNSMNLSFRNLMNTACCTLMNIAPWVFLIFDFQNFVYTLPLWTFGGFAILGYFTAMLLLRIFRKYETEEEEQP